MFLKGFMMGSADIVPGVSGGTVAYITGIYSNFINAIKSINKNTFTLLFAFKFKEAFQTIHYKFLGILLLGIFTAFLTLSKAIVFCLKKYPEETHALFLGLMIASILIVAKDIKNWLSKDSFFLIIMAILAFFVTGTASTSEDHTKAGELSSLFIFLCGIIAITAMILPGLSGSFLLKVMGVYAVILESVGNLSTVITKFKLPPDLPTSLLNLMMFASGCIVGITIFSRILSYCLLKHHQATIACITGLMIGALKCLWPWVRTENSSTFQKGTFYLPELSNHIFVCAGLGLGGFILVITLEILMNRKNEDVI